jgi:LCP family protein required for cell wall assembly
MSAPTGPEPSAPAPPPDAGEARRRRLIAAVLTLVLVAGVAIAAMLFRPADTTPSAATQSPTETATPTETPTPEPPPAPAPPPPPEPIAELPPVAMNVLVIGSDSRGNAREQAAHTAATAESQDHRSDVLMLVHVPADRRTVQVISIMRDLWVDIPNYGGAKINTGLQVGGIPMVVRTVESLLGTHVDHTVMLDFGGFKTLTDALGGIDVNVTLPFQSTHDTQHVFTPGVNHLDGQSALEFVRERYAFIEGDYQRVRNQQTYLRAVLARLTGGGALNDVNVVRSLVGMAGPFLTVDQGFDAVAVGILAYGLRGLDPNACTFFTLPTAGVGTVGGASVVLPDYGGIGAVSAALNEGRLAEYAAAAGL